MLKYAIPIALFAFYMMDYHGFFIKQNGWIIGVGVLVLSGYRYRYILFCFINLALGFFAPRDQNFYLFFCIMASIALLADVAWIHFSKEEEQNEKKQ